MAKKIQRQYSNELTSSTVKMVLEELAMLKVNYSARSINRRFTSILNSDD